MLDANNYIGKMLEERYRLVRVIGRSASSLVFYAEDMMTPREDGTAHPVAIKVLDRDSGEYKLNSKSFHSEIRALASIPTNPHMVAVEDISFDEDEHFIVMEYVSGKTLGEYLKERGGTLPPKEIVSISLQLLQALRLAHEVGVIHRDVKPQNILVERADAVGKQVDIPGGADMPFVKLADFGIALLPDEDLLAMGEKDASTVYYVSPEQASGGVIDERSDLYSLGVVMYELATGKVPFDAESVAGVISKHQTEMPVHVRGVNGEIPAELDEVIFTALQKNPALRYRDAATMEKRLKEILKAMMPDRERAESSSLYPGQRVKVGGDEPVAARMPRAQKPQREEKAPPPPPPPRMPKEPKPPKPPKEPKPPKSPKAPKPPKEAKAPSAAQKKAIAAGTGTALIAVLTAVGALALVVLLVVGGVFLLPKVKQPITDFIGSVSDTLFGGEKKRDIKVPSLTGLVYNENATYEDGISVPKDKIKYEHSDDVDAGKVITQVPAPGVVLHGVTVVEITLTVSLGPEMVEFKIPEEYRTDFKSAKDYLRDSGEYPWLTVIGTPRPADTYTPGIPEGTVVGAIRVLGEELPLSIDDGEIYKNKADTIILIVQPPEPQAPPTEVTVVLPTSVLAKADDVREYFASNYPFLTAEVTEELTGDQFSAMPAGMVIGVRLADGTEYLLSEKGNMITFTVMNEPMAVTLLLSVGA